MKNIGIKCLWLVAGILLIVGGIVSMINPTLMVISVTMLLAGAMLIKGIIDIVIYVKFGKHILGSSWLLTEAILTCILAVFVIFNQWISIAVVPFLFAVWIICTGLAKVAEALEIKKLEVDIWWIALVIGILEVLLGIVSIVLPISALFTLGLIVGMLFIGHGMITIIQVFLADKIVKN